MRGKRFTEEQIITVLKDAEVGAKTADLCRRHGVSEQTFSLPGARVVQVLDHLAETRGRPEEFVLDNGPEFIGRALDQWAYGRGVRLQFITPGKPVQNAHTESFHGRFRDECLNESWFLTLADARRTIEAWRQDYNTVRPHSALGYLTPEEFERMSRNGAERTPEKASMGARLAPEESPHCLTRPTPRARLGALRAERFDAVSPVRCREPRWHEILWPVCGAARVSLPIMRHGQSSGQQVLRTVRGTAL